MINNLLEIIFPTCCGICKRLYKTWICPKCFYNINKEFKYAKIKEKDFYLYYIGKYEGNIRKLLLKFKFKESSYLANTFIEIIAKNKEFVECIQQYDYIVPVPMHETNKRIRGYNQTELLAEKIKEKFKIDYINDILFKEKLNKKQSTLSERERIENVRNIYKLKNGHGIKNKKVLLLDDIYTTGSTVKSCIQELKKSQVKVVDVLVIAKTKI